MSRKTALFMAFVMFLSLFSNLTVFPASKAAAAASAQKFDFGSAGSPVAEGYTQVTNTMEFTEERGYGISKSSVGFRDRGGPDDLRSDFIIDGNNSFLVDLPNGEYHITLIAGDNIAFNRTGITIEGQDKGNISSSAGDFAEYTEVVTITDGQLNIDLDENGRINGLEVVPMLDPVDVSVENKQVTGDLSIELGWNAVDGAAGYNVYKQEQGETDYVLAGNTETAGFIDTEVELGLDYSYTVSAVNSAGLESTRSEPVHVSMTDEGVTVPAAPSDLKLDNATEESVSFSWEAVDDAVTYYIYRSTAADGEYERIGTSNETSYTDDSVITMRNFYYKVYAVNAGGLSDGSEALESPISKVVYRQMEDLDRGLVAMKQDDGVYVGWRMLGTDSEKVKFHLFRDGKKVNKQPIQSSTNFFDEEGTEDSTYQIRVIGDGKSTLTEPVEVWDQEYLDIPLDKPEGGTTPDGDSYTYSANDASVGDVDGDGQYEIILKWYPSNAQDNSRSGFTGNTYIDAYELDGTKLWRIDLGKNIRSGAHYTQFMVYDLDGDGKSEVAMKTADGTIDGTGTVIGDADADYRNSDGYVLDGPEFLTVFDGETGTELDTVDYYPPRGNVSEWGDGYGNRVDRFLAGVAYLDGERPSLVMARGYYTRSVLAAYDFRNGELTQRWVFDSDEPGNEGYAGQGNHNLSIADVDFDGKDEIVYGAMAVDDDGTGLYTTGLGHGDAMHLSDLDPNRPGYELFQVHEPYPNEAGMEFRDAETGELIWGVPSNQDVGRGLAADIDPRYEGAESWAIDGAWNSTLGSIYTAEGEKISSTIPPANFAIWWDGDLLREVLDHNWDDESKTGVGTIGKWDYENSETDNLLTAEGTLSNNSTKGNPVLQADILGDWREEVIWRTEDSTALRLYSTTSLTEHRIHTLMHDPVYRMGIAWQNVGYNQPPHTSFFLGAGMEEVSAPDIYLAGE